ncbi:MAG: gliding motility lipoprotein GldH [Prevotella sp.]
MKRWALWATVVLGILSACGNKVYDKYRHTQVQGWEKNDTLFYDVPPIVKAGDYDVTLGLRVNNAYPFTGLTLIVEQKVIPGGKVYIDTLDCRLTNKHGIHKQHGISYFQYTQPVRREWLEAADSLHVTVRHDMKRDILPGVSDVGIALTRHVGQGAD